MLKEKKLEHFKRMLEDVERHQLAREVDLIFQENEGVKGLDKVKEKSMKRQMVQEHKNYLDTIKDQIESDKKILAIISDLIAKLEKSK